MRIGKAYGMVKYIDENISDDLSYKSIAHEFHMSEKSLYKFFKQETGFTLSKYIRERRIIKAKSLLNTGMSAGEVARAVGFQDYSVFYRNFLKEDGIPPTEYTRK